MIRLTLGCSVFSNFITSRRVCYGKLEKQVPQSFCSRPRKLLIHHSASKPEMLGLLCHVIVAERGAQSASSVIAQQEFVESRVNSALNHTFTAGARSVNRQSSRHGDFMERKRRYMNILRKLRNYWIPSVTTIVLVCFNPAVAQDNHRMQGRAQDNITFSAPGAGTGAGQRT